MSLAERRVPAFPGPVLAVHAHPDDESLWTGLALAAAGPGGHVLTCTLGEEGEVIPEDLRHLEGATGDPLAAHRRGELREALAELGVGGEILLRDGGRRYRDSGMAGSPSAAHPDALAAAPVEEVSVGIAAVIARIRPAVVLTYDARGGYGHPDHIAVHLATRAALRTLGDPPLLYAAVVPLSWAQADRAWLRRHLDPALGWSVPAQDQPHPSAVVPDALVEVVVQDREALRRQRAALARHRTQVLLAEGAYALSNRVAARLAGREAYARVDPASGRLAAQEAG